MMEAAMSKQGRLVVRPGVKFNGVKIFSATQAMQREALGDNITRWLADHPECKPTEMIVTQSSDSAFHCITITVLYKS
ncbi:MAG: hypothetical protein QM831_36955 [Kofleriaceae bacterium]